MIESKIISIEIYNHDKQFRQYLLESIKTLLIANGYNMCSALLIWLCQYKR